MLAFYSVCSIFWLFPHEAIFLIQVLFHYSFYFRISETLLSNKCKTITLEVTQKRLYWTGGLLQNNCQWLLLMVLQGKMFSIFLSPYAEFSRVLCFKSSPTEFTGLHSRGNITLEINLHGRIILLKGTLLFHSYTRSITKTFLWLQKNAWLF